MSDPLALHNFVATLLVFGAPVGSLVVENQRFRGDTKRRWSDPTYWQLEVWQIAGLILGVLLAKQVPAAALPERKRVALARVGVCRVGLTGVALRWWAIRTLGAHSTRNLQVVADQQLVVDGPYRYLRHPSYTGAILMYAGVGIGLGNVVGLAIRVVFPAIGFVRRIPVEGGPAEATAGRAVRRVRESHSTLASLAFGDARGGPSSRGRSFRGWGRVVAPFLLRVRARWVRSSDGRLHAIEQFDALDGFLRAPRRRHLSGQGDSRTLAHSTGVSLAPLLSDAIDPPGFAGSAGRVGWRRSYETWRRNKCRHGHPDRQEPEKDDHVASIGREESVPGKSGSPTRKSAAVASDPHRYQSRVSPGRTASATDPISSATGKFTKVSETNLISQSDFAVSGVASVTAPKARAAVRNTYVVYAVSVSTSPRRASLPAMVLPGMTSSESVAKRSASKKTASI